MWDQVTYWISLVVGIAQDLFFVVFVLSQLIILISAQIPGEEPDRSLQRIVDAYLSWISKISRK